MKKSSGVYTSSKALMTQGGCYYGMTVLGRAGGLNQVTLYDNPTAAAGTVVDEAIVTSGVYYHSAFGDKGLYCVSGLYASVTGNVRVVSWQDINPLQG